MASRASDSASDIDLSPPSQSPENFTVKFISPVKFHFDFTGILPVLVLLTHEVSFLGIGITQLRVPPFFSFLVKVIFTKVAALLDGNYLIAVVQENGLVSMWHIIDANLMSSTITKVIQFTSPIIDLRLTSSTLTVMSSWGSIRFWKITPYGVMEDEDTKNRSVVEGDSVDTDDDYSSDDDEN
jgi:hypothetical protein